MRQRIEDLGRLMVLLDQLWKDDIFLIIERTVFSSAKNFADSIQKMSKEEQWEFLNKIGYGIDRLQDKIVEALEIARGDDYLNREEDGKL